MLVLINKYKKIVSLIFLGILMATLGFSKVAQADYSTSDVQSIIGETPFYYGQSSCQSSGGGGTTSGSSQNIEIAYQFLVANGYSPTGAAAIVGTMNSSEDSGLDPTKEEDDGTNDGGYGIAQWTPPTAMIAWVTAQGQDPNSLQGQLNYLLYDLKTNDPTVAVALQSATDITTAVTDYVDGFERPKYESVEIAQSIPDATQILQQYGGQTVSSSPSSSSSSSSCSTTGSGSSGGSSSSSGSYQNPLRSVQSLVAERVDMGVDYGGSGPVYALGDGTIDAISNGGWPDGNFVEEKMTDGPASGKYVYVAEYCSPLVTIGQQVTSTTAICDMSSGNTGIETGWSAGDGGDTISESAAAGSISGASSCIQDNIPTEIGLNYNDLLISLGSKSGLVAGQNPAQACGMLPSGWPTWSSNG